MVIEAFGVLTVLISPISFLVLEFATDDTLDGSLFRLMDNLAPPSYNPLLHGSFGFKEVVRQSD